MARSRSLSTKSGILLSTMSSWPTSPQSPSPMTPFQRLGSSRASEIIPRLYVSDIYIAESTPALTALGITHVLSAMRGYVAIPPELQIQHCAVPLDDLPFSELAAHLPTTTAFLRDALRDPNARVLVHCEQGISRSTSVVCAFLMAEYGWSSTRAVEYIKTKRRTAEPNFGFVQQLKEYGDSL